MLTHKILTKMLIIQHIGTILYFGRIDVQIVWLIVEATDSLRPLHQLCYAVQYRGDKYSMIVRYCTSEIVLSNFINTT